MFNEKSMKLNTLLMIFLIFNAKYTIAQTNATDSIRKMKQPKISLSVEIESGLKKIMEQYRNQINTEDTWTSIKNEAENFLYPYYRKGRFAGSKTQDAYFVKIGVQTMTASDIQANKKILIAGFSEYKPAEFQTITIETIPLKKNGKL